MRKSIAIGLGVASAAVVAIGGVAAASTAGDARGTTPAAQVAAASTDVSQLEAEQIALAIVPDGTIVETRLDTDAGRTVWNVHLSTPDGIVEVKVDVQTGDARVDDDNDDVADDDGGLRDNDDGANHDAGDDNGGQRGDNSGPGSGEDSSGHGGSDDNSGPGSDDSSGHGGSGRG